MVGVHKGQQRTSLVLVNKPPKMPFSCFAFALDLDLAVAISRVKHSIVHCFTSFLSPRLCRSCFLGERPILACQPKICLSTHGVLNSLRAVLA